MVTAKPAAAQVELEQARHVALVFDDDHPAFHALVIPRYASRVVRYLVVLAIALTLGCVLLELQRPQGAHRRGLGSRPRVRRARQGVRAADRTSRPSSASARAACSRSRSSKARRSSCSPRPASEFADQVDQGRALRCQLREALRARPDRGVDAELGDGADQARGPRRLHASRRSRSRTPSTRRTAGPRSRRSRRPASGRRSSTGSCSAENVQATMQYARDGTVDVAIVALSLAVVSRRRCVPPDRSDAARSARSAARRVRQRRRGRRAHAVRRLHHLARGSRDHDALRLPPTRRVAAQAMKPETLAAQALHAIDATTGAIVPPIHLVDDVRARRRVSAAAGRTTRATTTRRASDRRARARGARRRRRARWCSRRGWPRRPPRSARVCKPGDHVDRAAGRLLRRCATGSSDSARGGASRSISSTRPTSTHVRAALRPGTTRLVWIETPANPTWDVTDIARGREPRPRRRRAASPSTRRARRPCTRDRSSSAPIWSCTRRPSTSAATPTCSPARSSPRATDDAWASIAELRHDEGACIGPVEAWLAPARHAHAVRAGRALRAGPR